MCDRQITAGVAIEIVEKVPRTANPAMRKIVAENLIRGYHAPLYIQGMLAGLKVAHELLLHKAGSNGAGTGLLTDLTVEVANHYLSAIDSAASA